MSHPAASLGHVMHRETAIARSRSALSLSTAAALAARQAPLVTPDNATPPAVVTEESSSGPFATGKSLSFDATLRPLDPDPVKEVRLDASNKVIDLAPGVKYSAWTLGDQVPGPTVRARVGDRIRFSMSNRTDAAMPGMIQIGAPMMHSMDFHAAMGSPQNIFHSIRPRQSISFEFVPSYPGV